MTDEGGKADDGIAGVFGRAAATFDPIGRFVYFGERLVERAGIETGNDILDVATGRGASAIPAARRAGPRGRVTGTDISADMLRETAKDVQSGGLVNIDLQQMNAEQLQYEDGTFDVVLCGFGLMFFPRPERALAEILRVLRSGGRLALTTWAHDSPVFNLNSDALNRHLVPHPGADARASRQRFDTKERLNTVLRHVGFSNIEILTEDFTAILADGGMLWTDLWSTSRRGELERMPAARLEVFRADYHQRLEALRQSDGIHAVYRALITLARKPS